MSRKIIGFEDELCMSGAQFKFFQNKEVKTHAFLKVFINKPSKKTIEQLMGPIDIRFIWSKNILFFTFAPQGTYKIYDAPYSPALALENGEIAEKLTLGDGCDITLFVIDSSTMEVVATRDTTLSKRFFRDFIVHSAKILDNKEKPTKKQIYNEIKSAYIQYTSEELWNKGYYFGEIGCPNEKEED